jgi:hypothetical protein
MGEVLNWLRDADPALRWQVLQDLDDAPPREVAAERARMLEVGWVADLLSRQDPDGRWAGALYSPKWTSTTYTLLLLQRLGLPSGHPQALTGCQVLWDGARYFDGGLTLAKTIREPETCITAMLVRLAESFGYDDARVQPAVAWLLGQQLADGGWNCETVRSGSQHGSFHTTISALEALQSRQSPGAAEMAALSAGRGFLLAHGMFRSQRTGEVIDPAYLRFPFPPQWHYDVLRGLEHFREAGAPYDDRLAEAVQVVRDACRADGRWRRSQPYPGRYWWALEPAGPSRWATLRALRVLRWADSEQ